MIRYCGRTKRGRKKYPFLLNVSQFKRGFRKLMLWAKKRESMNGVICHRKGKLK